MANGLVKKLILAGAIGASALGGVKEARSAPVEWGSFEDVVPVRHGDYPAAGGVSRDYVSASINFRDIETGNLLTDNPNFSMVYFAYFPEYNSYEPVGGLDGSGTSASGWFNNNLGFSLGLEEGQTANHPLDNGYWQIFVDRNGDGKYGTYDFERGHFFTPDELEWVGRIRVENFTPFSIGGGSLSAGDFYGSYDSVPEPGVSALLLTGLSALALRRRRNLSKDKQRV